MENQPLNALEKPPPYSIATAPAVNVPYQPPPGYYPNNTDTGYQENYIPSYGSVHSTAIIVPEIILVGGCPACRVCIDFLLFECYYICLHMLQSQKIDIQLT